jgi:hypothetical protein
VDKFVGKNSRVATILAGELSTEPLLIRTRQHFTVDDHLNEALPLFC